MSPAWRARACPLWVSGNVVCSGAVQLFTQLAKMRRTRSSSHRIAEPGGEIQGEPAEGVGHRVVLGHSPEQHRIGQVPMGGGDRVAVLERGSTMRAATKGNRSGR